MIRLNSTRKLQAVLDGAVAATQPSFIVNFSEHAAAADTYLGGVSTGALNSTTDADLLAAPDAATKIRDIDFLSIFNRDSASVTVTVKYDVSGTDTIILTVTLATLETLQYTHAQGWYCLDASGRIKIPFATSLTPGGSSGDVQYNNGSGGLSAEAAFNYDATNDILSIPDLRLGTDKFIRLDEHSSAPGTPAAGNVSVYAKADGLVYGKDDAGTETALSNAAAAGGGGPDPGGRLTLTTATPVMVSDVSNSTSIFYALYKHDQVPIYNGTAWTMTTFTELTNTTTDSTVNPAAVAADSNYDLFVWNDAGTLRLGRGPAWTSATGRGTGAGTTELERVLGVWTNKVDITNGPAAQRGTYVGTVRSDSASTIDWELGGSAANGDPGFLYVWNAYNRVQVNIQVRDTTDTWTYATNTVRSANGSTSNRVSAVFGLNEESVSASYNGCGTIGAGVTMEVGIGLDTTSAHSGTFPFFSNVAMTGNQVGSYEGFPGLGHHFFQAVENAFNAATVTFRGDNADATKFQSGMVFLGRF